MVYKVLDSWFQNHEFEPHESMHAFLLLRTLVYDWAAAHSWKDNRFIVQRTGDPLIAICILRCLAQSPEERWAPLDALISVHPIYLFFLSMEPLGSMFYRNVLSVCLFWMFLNQFLNAKADNWKLHISLRCLCSSDLFSNHLAKYSRKNSPGEFLCTYLCVIC